MCRNLARLIAFPLHSVTQPLLRLSFRSPRSLSNSDWLRKGVNTDPVHTLAATRIGRVPQAI